VLSYRRFASFPSVDGGTNRDELTTHNRNSCGHEPFAPSGFRLISVYKVGMTRSEGRSSDLRAKNKWPTIHSFPDAIAPSAFSWISFSITAAGQSRNHTEFPISCCLQATRAPNTCTTYCGQCKVSSCMMYISPPILGLAKTHCSQPNGFRT